MHDSFLDPRNIEMDNNLTVPHNLPPFLGGLVGFIGYEMKSETLSCSSGQHRFKTLSMESIPDSSFLFADRTIVFDHQESKIYLIALVDHAGDLESNGLIQTNWIQETAASLKPLVSLKSTSPYNPDIPIKKISQIKLTHSNEVYVGMIKKSIAKIEQGETYEVCLTTQLKAQIALPHPRPYEMYKHLRHRNPAPYAAYLSLGKDLVITSSSPERFLRIANGGSMTMKPIKGTLKTASSSNFKGTPEEIHIENEKRKLELETSEKNRSENLMIVDLIRNDLNQISLPNSVHVPALMVVETYATVHQLVSTVAAILKPELTAVDAVMRSFPPGYLISLIIGSMTGAPKLRTVQIIEELEEIPRGPYAGVLGFFSVCGQADLSVVIRTAVFDRSKYFN